MDGRLIADNSTSIDSATPSSAPENFCRVGSLETRTEVESRKLPSSRFKGVVPQPNGRWGAQIYEKHQRVWLGTFNDEEEAAKVYDTAAQRFRGRDAVVNFKRLSESVDDVIETAFLFSHLKSEIVDMLRKHTYHDELEQSQRISSLIGVRDIIVSESKILGVFHRDSEARELLFEKSVTPSDVGKLNRLVIPKQHAEKHFPLQIGSTTKGMLLNFEDNGGNLWRFRYSYWSSSQSYVLTRGWSRFVKEKNLKSGDCVSFERSNGPEKQLYIEWRSRSPTQMVRLFGVDIFKTPVHAGGVGGCSRRRVREMELLAMECGKKQRIIGAL